MCVEERNEIREVKNVKIGWMSGGESGRSRELGSNINKKLLRNREVNF